VLVRADQRALFRGDPLAGPRGPGGTSLEFVVLVRADQLGAFQSDPWVGPRGPVGTPLEIAVLVRADQQTELRAPKLAARLGVTLVRGGTARPSLAAATRVPCTTRVSTPCNA